MGNRKGFTLIELVMIIVILGALAVVAIPRYIDMQNEARVSSLKSILGAFYTAKANMTPAMDAGIESLQAQVMKACPGFAMDGPPSDDWLKCIAKWSMNGDVPENPFTGKNDLQVTRDSGKKPCDTIDPQGGWVFQFLDVKGKDAPPRIRFWANSSEAELDGGGTEACVQPGGD